MLDLVWCLIVSIPDLCLLSYFYDAAGHLHVLPCIHVVLKAPPDNNEYGGSVRTTKYGLIVYRLSFELSFLRR